jgi:murein L,D-transpeptidase YafK
MVAGSLRLKRSSPFWRVLMASAALAASVALTGCQTDGVDLARAMTPLSPRMLAMFDEKGMAKESPILARVFKEESELEIWKQDNTGRFALLKTYPICRWSGELGPKIKQGDRQAPEGFYTITPGQMNPNSSYYLSFNMGYPNAFDRAHGRTGAHLMVHGDCSSAGCYAMTNEQIAEIYALARESFFGGQQAFQIQAYPFRMTPLNMAKHRSNPHFAFWKMLKQGYDHFEVSRLEPKVNVCDRRYVFDAESPNASRPLRFDPNAQCPAYQVNQELREAVAEKQRDDEVKFADLVRRGTSTVAVRTGRDGGMHPTFFAKLAPRLVRDADGKERYEIDPVQAAKLGTYVNPPKDPDVPPAQPAYTGSTGISLASAESKPAPRAAAAPTAAKPEEGTFSKLTRWVGFGGNDPKPTPAQKNATPAAPAQAQAARPVTASAIQPNRPKPQQEASAPEQPRASFAPASQPLMSGATPVIGGDSFENRFGQVR